MSLDPKKLKALGKLIEQEQKHWPKPLREKLAALGSLAVSPDSKRLEELGKLFERELKPLRSPIWESLAKLGAEGPLGKSDFAQMPNLKKLPVVDTLHKHKEWEQSLYDPKTWERIFQRIDEQSRPRRVATAGETAGSNLPSGKRRKAQAKPDKAEGLKGYLSFDDLAKRWNVSRRTVYRRLRTAGAEVLSFAKRGERSKKTVSLAVVTAMERKHTKRLA